MTNFHNHHDFEIYLPPHPDLATNVINPFQKIIRYTYILEQTESDPQTHVIDCKKKYQSRWVQISSHVLIIFVMNHMFLFPIWSSQIKVLLYRLYLVIKYTPY